MKIEILGYWGGYPKDGGATTGYLITTDEGKILLDCGSGVLSKLSTKTKVEELSGVILTHLHYDHMSDIGVLQYAAFGALRNKRMIDKIKVYAPNEPKNFWDFIQNENVDSIPITEESHIQIAGAEIEFLSVKHTIPCYAVKISYKGQVFVFSADTEYIDSLIDFARGADLFFCEATICEGSVHTVGKGHMDAEQAATIAKNAGVKTLVLTHLPHDGNFGLMKETASSIFEGTVYMAFENESYILSK